MAKYLKQTKKEVFEVLRKIMRKYDSEIVYTNLDKEKAINNTLHSYWNYYEWLQKQHEQPKKIKPKLIHRCQICGYELNKNGFCPNERCEAYSPVINT